MVGSPGTVVLDRAGGLGDAVEMGLLGEEPADLEVGVEARFEPSEDLEDQAIAEEDCRVALLGRAEADRPRRVVRAAGRVEGVGLHRADRAVFASRPCVLGRSDPARPGNSAGRPARRGGSSLPVDAVQVGHEPARLPSDPVGLGAGGGWPAAGNRRRCRRRGSGPRPGRSRALRGARRRGSRRRSGPIRSSAPCPRTSAGDGGNRARSLAPVATARRPRSNSSRPGVRLWSGIVSYFLGLGIFDKKDLPASSAVRGVTQIARCRPEKQAVRSLVIIEIMFGLDLPADPEDVRRVRLRVELNEVPRPVPEVAGIADQVVDLVRVAWPGAQFQLLDRAGSPSRIACGGGRG